MPLPKRKHSVQRGRKRRTHWKAKASSLGVCPQCKQPKLPHTVCKVCGSYGKKKLIEIKVKKNKNGHK